MRSVSTFRQGLVELGHTVFVFAQAAQDYTDAEPFIFRYPSLDLGLPGDFPATFPFSPFVNKLLPSLHVDVVHSHHPFLLGHVAAEKAEELGLPLVFTFHTRYREYSHYISLSQEFVDVFIREAIESWLKKYMHRCQHIVVPSRSMARILAEEYGVSADDTTVVPTGIDLAPYQVAGGEAVRRRHGWGDDRVLISIGRLAPEKNWGTLLAASLQVMADRPDVRLVVIGDGDERDELVESADAAGIGARVTFTGSVPFDQIPAYLQAADLFCFASVTETQGLVTLEAMAAGLPVVAVDATGTRDVVEADQQGILTDNDPAALAQAIGQVLDDPERMARYCQAGLVQAKAFGMQVQARKLVAVYEEAQAAKQAGRTVQVAEAK